MFNIFNDMEKAYALILRKIVLLKENLDVAKES
jgi:hypothetical protein